MSSFPSLAPALAPTHAGPVPPPLRPPVRAGPPPPARQAPTQPPFGLASLAAVDREISRQRSEVSRLQAECDVATRRRAAAHEEKARLEGEITQLDEKLLEHHRRIQGLLAGMEPLLHARTQIRRQATVEASRLAASASAAPMLQPGMVENRQHPRVPLAVEVELEGETNFFVGFSQDISAGGLFVCTYMTRPVGDCFPLVFTLPGHPTRIHALVEVAWVREYADGRDLAPCAPPGMGLRFVGLETGAQDAIARFLQRRQPLFFPESDEAA